MTAAIANPKWRVTCEFGQFGISNDYFATDEKALKFVSDTMTGSADVIRIVRLRQKAGAP